MQQAPCPKFSNRSLFINKSSVSQASSQNQNTERSLINYGVFPFAVRSTVTNILMIVVFWPLSALTNPASPNATPFWKGIVSIANECSIQCSKNPSCQSYEIKESAGLKECRLFHVFAGVWKKM